ncbi:hypothetical protein CHN50_20950 [Priestia aryabhattai]|nr:hypothetical protein CHN50_20950 [Priestia aryabhattai]
MEILMKSFEWRFHPAGHVYKTEVNSLIELQLLFYSQCIEDGKRTGEAYFKTESDDKWLEYEEFILKYFKYELRLPQFGYGQLELIGFEDESGNFESYKRTLEESW